MVDNVEAIELAEIEVARLIDICHKQLEYWKILRIFLLACQDLYIKAGVEYQMKMRS